METLKTNAGKQIAACNPAGAAAIVRISNDSVRLQLSYRVPDMHALLTRGSLAQGVVGLCETEIQIVRRQLANLGEQLIAQLEGKGTTCTGLHTFESHDSRQWSDSNSALSVAESAYECDANVALQAGVAPASAVGNWVTEFVRHREASIQKLYALIYRDVLAQRAIIKSNEAN